MNKKKVNENDPRWLRLEKIWLEEKLSISVLSERFGINEVLIQKRLKSRYGTSSPEIYNSTL